jgi:hypothetical protein
MPLFIRIAQEYNPWPGAYSYKEVLLYQIHSQKGRDGEGLKRAAQ